MSVSEGLICETIEHAFDVRPNNRDSRFSGVQHRGLQYSVGVAKLSVERGFRVKLGMDYCPLYGVGGSNVLKSMEKRSGLSELSVISWVSVKRGSTVVIYNSRTLVLG